MSHDHLLTNHNTQRVELGKEVYVANHTVADVGELSTCIIHPNEILCM